MMIRRIEKERRTLSRLVEKYGLSDPRVLAKSRELDELLNQYQSKKGGRKGKNDFPAVPEFVLLSG